MLVQYLNIVIIIRCLRRPITKADKEFLFNKLLNLGCFTDMLLRSDCKLVQYIDCNALAFIKYEVTVLWFDCAASGAFALALFDVIMFMCTFLCLPAIIARSVNGRQL